LQRLAEIAVQALSEFAFVFAVDDDGALACEGAASRDPALQWCVERMREMPSAAPPPRGVERARLNLETVVMTLAHEDDPVHVADKRLIEAMRAASPRHALATPLLFGGTVLGVLLLSRRDEAFASDDVVLAEEVARRVGVFLENARLRRAERSALEARDAVLAVVAHDLRGHLATVSLHAQVLARRGSGGDPRILESAAAIRSAVERAAVLIDDLLDTAMPAERVPPPTR
jgi:GAF domain-containing protein